MVSEVLALPPTRTVDDLRGVLSRYGFPGDREHFEDELAAAVGTSPIDDFADAAVRERDRAHAVTSADVERGKKLMAGAGSCPFVRSAAS
ncbi:hypothetical protein [Streptomyces canus]|uniref:hypothetical protein n=1 Tax=Streptomyces canus TaxID=58343 RepID=UPI0037FB0D0A